MRRIIIVLMMLAVCTGFFTEASAGKKSSSDELTREHINRSEISPVPKSEKVVTGNVEWKILKVEEVGPVLEQEYTGATLETKGKFVNIRLEAVNHSEDLKYIYDLRLVDDRGRTYPICAAAYAYFGMEEACSLAELLPDVRRTLTMFHDVPLNANDLWLEVTDLEVPPQEKKYIDLGI